MNIINKSQVLKLNRNWIAIDQSCVGDAIVGMFSGALMAIDIEYEKDENGQYILNEYGWPKGQSWPRPVSCDEWLLLPVRSFDEAIHYSNGSKVMRSPTVVICNNYSKVLMKTFKGKPSKEGLWIRDGGRCQYTGKKLKKQDASIDHIKPKSKGGDDSWENQVVCSKEINFKKGNKSNKEAGLNLIKEPTTPRPIPQTQLIREIKRFEWKEFLPHLLGDEI